MRKIYMTLVILLVTIATGLAQKPGNSWVKTITYLDKAGTRKIEDINRLNGMGLPFIIIHKGASPAGGDIVQPIWYDAAARDDAKIFLPYARTENDSLHRNNVFLEQAVYYASAFAGDAYPYAEKIYEGTLLNRVIKTYKPGGVFRTANKYMASDYLANSSSDKVYDISINGMSGSFAVKRYYPDIILYKTTQTNEDGMKITIFADRDNRVLLQRAELSPGVFADTYQVYDLMGQLRCVVSPEGSKQLVLNMVFAPSDEICTKYCYYYLYDDREQMVEKRLPGKGREQMVYDKTGRVVMFRDAVLEGQNRWVFNLYDNQDRLIRQNIVQGNMTREQIQTAYNSFNNILDKSLPNHDLPLWDTRFSTVAHVSEIIYGLPGQGIPAVLSFQPTGEVTTLDIDSRVSGMTTLEKKYIMDEVFYSASPRYVETAYYYDYAGRVIQSVTRNHLGGISRNTFEYDFKGNVTRAHESHQRSVNAIADILVTNYSMDDWDRVMSITTTLNGGIPAIVTYQYNATGQLTGKTYGTGDTATGEKITYNIQGWITRKNSSLFDMQLGYNDATKALPCYSGNIAEWKWQHKNPQATLNTYAFTYDKFGRFTDAELYEGTTKSNRTRERVTGYDLNGNILTLNRAADGNIVDNLVYSYSGNRLTGLTENVRTALVGDVYAPGNTPGGTYSYDQNGNMINDSRRNLNFTYNVLNLLNEVKSGSSIKAKYNYLADGVKLRVRDGNDTNGFDYLGSLTYKKNSAGLQLETVNFGNGMIRVNGSNSAQQEVNYFLTDHLGSVRVIVDGSGMVKERNDYYPFGARHVRGDYPKNDNRLKYNGKEEQVTGDLKYLDYGARMYDNGLGRWFGFDAMSEHYYNISPFVYCLNDPIKYIDPDGNKVKITNNLQGAMYNLAKIIATNTGRNVVNTLMRSSNIYQLTSIFWSGLSQYDDKNGRNIEYVGNPWIWRVDGGALSSELSMGHELFHAYQDETTFNYRNSNGNITNVQGKEEGAVGFANYLRRIWKQYPYRIEYRGYINFKPSPIGDWTEDGISDFKLLGFNKSQTQFGYIYTRGSGRNKTVYYIMMSVDEKGNVTYKYYDNESEFNRTRDKW